MSESFLRILLTTAFIVIFGLMIVPAQVRLTSSLRGTVTDPNGAAVPGATVTLINDNTKAERVTNSGEGGEYQFEQLQPGTYRLRVERNGFRTVLREEIQLLVATASTLEVQLSIGEVGETVTVDAGASPLNTQDVTIGNVIGEREVRNLPSAGRNPLHLVSLQPGVVFTGETNYDRLLLGLNDQLDDREGATFGVRGNQSRVQIDGAETTDPETQAAFGTLLPVTLDSVREFRVTTNGANASEVSTGGPQVTFITNSGANAFRGNARMYDRNDATAANDFFSNASGFSKPKLLRNIFGGSVGGPIKREHAFFFFDYEGRVDRSELPESRYPTNVLVPSDTLRQGIIRYVNTAGQIVSLSGDQIRFIDPAGLGVNPAALAALQLYPRGNAAVTSATDSLNISRFSYSAPLPTDAHIYTARLDFNLTRDGSHNAYIRGTAAEMDSALLPALFPGAEPSQSIINKSKGFAVSYTAQASPSVVNNFTWGLTLPRINRTGQEGNTLRFFPFTGFGFGGDRSAQAVRGVECDVSINDFSDDITWVVGSHTLQFGGLMRFSRNRRASSINAFSSFQTFPFRCIGDANCVAGVNRLRTDATTANDPSAVSVTRIRDAFFALAGLINSANAFYNLNPRTGEYESGELRGLEFVEDTYETYVQDSWRLRPNLTITAGVRYSFTPPIYERGGQQLSPNVDIHDWFARRVNDMQSGIAADRAPLMGFDLAGQANERSSWYGPDANNFAPRFAIAYNPNFKNGLLRRVFGAQKSVIRAGFGVYFDRVGGPLALTTDEFGSPGQTLNITSEARFRLAEIPRFAGTCTLNACTPVPNVNNYITTPDAIELPFEPQQGGPTALFVVDNRLKNPNTTHINVSIQRELPGKFVMDVGYVGTFGRKLLTKADVAQYYGELKDPLSGQTMWGALNQIVDLIGPNLASPRINPSSIPALQQIAPIAFVENMMPNMPATLGAPPGALTATQAFYSFIASGARPNVLGPSWTLLLWSLDTEPQFGDVPSPWNTQLDPERDAFVLFNPQFDALPAWTNWGRSDYHGTQITVRRSFGRAQFALNYTFSKSLDNASAAENNRNQLGGFFYNNGLIANAFHPNAERARSDFDLRHNLNAHWLLDLPFGRGARFFRDARGVVDVIVGGWQFAGIARYHSGFPLGVFNGSNNFATSFNTPDFATAIGPVETDLTRNGEWATEPLL